MPPCLIPTHTILRRLDARRVQHDADSATQGLGGQVASELGADDTTTAVRAGDAAPDDAQVGLLTTAGVALGVLGLVHVCDALAQVELRVLGISKALDLNQAGVVVLVHLGTAQQEGVEKHIEMKTLQLELTPCSPPRHP